MANRNDRNERRARAEEMIRAQKAKERRTSFLIIGAALVVVIGLLVAAAIPYINNERQKSKLAGTDLAKLGVSRSAAQCSPVTTKTADGSGQHTAIGTTIKYPDAPPAFGSHWPNFLQGSEIRPFYTPSDRPELERMVHSLEHGHTIVWYDDTVKKGTKAYSDLEKIADKLPQGSYFMAAPWTSKDGKSFPDGKHIAITHWTGPDKQKGVWEYCGAPSGSVIKSFMAKYPASDAPEPGAA